MFLLCIKQSTFFAYKTLHCTFNCVFKKYLEHILLGYLCTRQSEGLVSGVLFLTFVHYFLIAAAMQVMNGKGIVHRDLKPQNILLCHDGKPNTPSTEMRLKIGKHCCTHSYIKCHILISPHISHCSALKKKPIELRSAID